MVAVFLARIFYYARMGVPDRKSTRLNSSHGYLSYAVFCLKKYKQRLVGVHTGAVSTEQRLAHECDALALGPRGVLDDVLVHFFFNDGAPPGIYPLSLHGPLPV